MPYQTGTAVSLTDFATKLRSFLTANGWTLAGSDICYKGTVFSRIWDDGGNNFYVEAGTGQTAGSLTGAFGEAPRIKGNPWTSKASFNVTWPATYHFFAHTSPDGWLAVLHHDTLYVQWAMAGEITKLGTWAGGLYHGASYPYTYRTNTDYDSTRFFNFDNYQYSTSNASTVGFGWGNWWGSTKSGNGQGNIVLSCDVDGNTLEGNYDNRMSGVRLVRELTPETPNTFNDQAILIPQLITVERPDSFFSIVGYPAHTRHVNMRNFNIADILELGPEKWMCFPHFKYSAADMTDPVTYRSTDTGRLGFAVRYDGP